MKNQSLGRLQHLIATVALWILWGTLLEAAQFVEINAEIEFTSWHERDLAGLPIEKRNVFTAHCIVGTNAWLIEHDNISNARETWWFKGTTLTCEGLITRELLQTNLSIGHIPAVGTRYTNVHHSIDGYPRGDSGVTIPWLAFCSGSFLMSEGRRIPPPLGTGGRDALDYSVRTTAFDEPFGLPRRIEFRSDEAKFRGEYQVQESTNFVGRIYPMRFKLVQDRPNRLAGWEPHYLMVGRVTSIREATAAHIPAAPPRNWD